MASCQNCEVNMRKFILISSNKLEYINFLINHGLIRREIPCGRCEGRAELNINRFAFRCYSRYVKIGFFDFGKNMYIF